MLAQLAAVENVAEHIISANSTNSQLDQTVTEKDSRTGRQFVGKIGECSGNVRGGSGHVLRGGGHDGAGLQQNRFVSLEWPGANFRTLQVLENAKGAPFALGGTAEASNVTSVIFVSAVGKIEAGGVHAQAEPGADVRLGGTGW